MESIGEIIRRRISTRLDELGLTPITAAQKADLPRDTIRNLFRGDGAVPRVDTLADIARALETTVAYLVGEAAFHEANPLPFGSAPAMRQVEVVCELGWKKFVRKDKFVSGRTVPIAIPGYEDSVLYAGLVVDGHANLYYKVGSFVIFAPFAHGGYRVEDHVIVRRERGDDLEFTVRLLEFDRRRNLVLSPMRYGSRYGDMKTVPFESVRAEESMVGVVVGSYWAMERAPPGEPDSFYPATMLTEEEDAAGGIVAARVARDIGALEDSDDILRDLRGKGAMKKP